MIPGRLLSCWNGNFSGGTVKLPCVGGGGKGTDPVFIAAKFIFGGPANAKLTSKKNILNKS